MSDKIAITTQTGQTVEASAPVIISASRSTDIPAFYAKWFFNRLKKGYCAWYNPFNQQQKMYISFKNCKGLFSGRKIPSPFFHICMSWMKKVFIIISNLHLTITQKRALNQMFLLLTSVLKHSKNCRR